MVSLIANVDRIFSCFLVCIFFDMFIPSRIEVERLRIDYQISGLLTGTLPQLAQQNVFLGLPLQLMPEEVVVLVELG
jgi:hypothetical protein